MNKTYTAKVIENENGDLVLPLPQELLEELGWKPDDTLSWTDNSDDTFSLKKITKETEWVLVDTVSSFRKRYMVEVPIGKELWALDTVVSNEAIEFSQEFLGDQIVSHRVISKEDAIKMCDEDNDYGTAWNEKTKIKNFFTVYKQEE